MCDPLYEEFYDPTEDFAKEPRAFCYDVASQLIDKAKKVAGENSWIEDRNTIKGVLLLLFTWNFAAKETKQLNFDNLGTALRKIKKDILFLRDYTITNADSEAWDRIERVFEELRTLCGQTGAAKALSLLNPKLFVMWDTAIRSCLRKKYIPGIGNGQKGEQYVRFLQGIQRIIQKYSLEDKLPKGSNIAKKIDEYNYVRIVMRKNCT